MPKIKKPNKNRDVTVITTHVNADFDALASMLAAQKLYPDANTHPDVFRTALVGVGEFGSQRPVLCVELEKGADTSNLEKIHQQLIAIGAEHEVTSQIKTFLFHLEFPVDIRHNAKIFREKLAVWSEEKLS